MVVCRLETVGSDMAFLLMKNTDSQLYRILRGNILQPCAMTCYSMSDTFSLDIKDDHSLVYIKLNFFYSFL